MVDSTLYFSHVEQFKVLVCRKCEHCISPGGTEVHLRRSHRDIPLIVRKELIAFSDNLALDYPEAITAPCSCITMINGLKVIDGFKCMECGCLCGTEKSMRQHCKTQHGQFQNKGEKIKVLRQSLMVYRHPLDPSTYSDLLSRLAFEIFRGYAT
jgi:Orsellinic acid/F9775 biosynthesis cluster protein D